LTALDEKRNAELTRFASSVVSDLSSLQCTGSEPDFTNYAQIREDPVFIECLDYIFHSPSLKCVGVRTLPHRDNVQGPLPNAEEPSDHIMLGASFHL